MAEFTTTKRGACCLLSGGYQYTLNQRGWEVQMYWRCVDHNWWEWSSHSRKSCPDHPPETAQMTVAKVVEKMKQWAKNETTTINTIYRQTLQEIKQDPELADAAAVLHNHLSSHPCIGRGGKGFHHYQQHEVRWNLEESGPKYWVALSSFPQKTTSKF